MLAFVAAGAFAVCGCSGGSEPNGSAPSGGTAGTTASAELPAVPEGLKGAISIDGSSTVSPISTVAAERFMERANDVQITVAESGTSGGFKKFLNGEIDICGASRPITKEELATAKEKGIEFVELPVAFDGLTIAINKENAFATTMTVAELKKLWERDSTVKTWKDIRVDWPAEEIKLFGAGSDSGTFDYFTEAINGEKGNSRTDYTPSEHDNQLVMGVAGEKNGLGYFGYAYYEENKDKLTAVSVDNGSGGVAPTPETIANGSYAPLSRPLMIYIAKKAFERPEVNAFVEFYVGGAAVLVPEAKYIALPSSAYDAIKAHAAGMKLGSRMQGEIVGIAIEEILKREGQ